MNTTQLVLAARQAQLNLERGRREEATLKLKEIAVAGRQLKKACDEAQRAARRAIEAENISQARFVENSNDIQIHHAERPSPADFPSEQELAAWDTKLLQLTAKKNELASSLRDARAEAGRQRLAAIKAEMALTGIRSQQAHLQAIARGEEVAPTQLFSAQAGISVV